MTRNSDRGNFVSEWFGYRTYPHVYGSPVALNTQMEGHCPFLTAATREKRECVKNASSSGVCTINNASNGIRQDWLVCPYRALDPNLIEDVVRRLFAATSDRPVLVVPAPALIRPTRSKRSQAARFRTRAPPPRSSLRSTAGSPTWWPDLELPPEIS